MGEEFKISHPRWERLRVAGIDQEEVELRHCGDSLMLAATARLQNAVEAVAAHFCALLEASGPEEYAKVLASAKEDEVFPAYKDALAEFQKQVGLAFNFVCGLDGIEEAAEMVEAS